MVWFRVADDLAFHRRVLEAGNAAIGLWVKAGAWAATNNTAGFIPADITNQLGGTRLMYDRLVKAGLFEETPGGYLFRDWDYQDLTPYDKAARASRRPRLSAVPSTGHRDEQ
jgi:hypothetical protein